VRALSLLFALLAPSVASAGAGAIYAPDPRYIPGTYLPFQTYLGGLGISASLAGPSLQAINTGTGNAFEAYTGTGSVGILLSAGGAFPGPGLGSLPYSNSSDVPFGQYVGLYGSGGFSQMQNGNDFAGVHFGVNNTTKRGAIVYSNSFSIVGLLSSTGSFAFASGTNNGVASGTAISNGINTHIMSVNVGAGGKWTHFLRTMTGDTARSAWEWAFRNKNNNLQAIHTSWSKVDDTTQAVTNLVDLTYAAEFVPTVDNTGALGTNALRWGSVRAVTVTTGDLGFDDECCPVCGACFNTGEDVVWRIRRQKREDDGKTVSFAVPVHVVCSK
jgi:hypothetical protein